jgi:hypothetical protein
MRGRTRIWKNSAEPYVRVVAAKLTWRFKSLGYEEADFVQEAYFAFERCFEAYGTVLTRRGKLSPKFKRAIHNLATDLSNKATEEKSLLSITGVAEDISSSSLPSFEDSGYLRIFISQAPQEIKEVLSLVFNTPVELLEEFGKTKGTRGFNSNKRLCSLLGHNRFRVNLVNQIKEYFTEQPL